MVSRIYKWKVEKILQALRRLGKASQAQLSRFTGVSKPEVSSIIHTLLSKGVVKEVGVGESPKQGGRKPTYLSFVPTYKYVVAVDIGGTKILSSIVDLDGNIICHEISLSRGIKDKDSLMGKLLDIINKCLDRVEHGNVLGVGLGVPGTVDEVSGLIRHLPAFGLVNVDLRYDLEWRFRLPVIIGNDVTFGALGESWVGAAKELKNVILVSVGTGIGAGIVIDGKVYTGLRGNAGEIGEMVTDWSKESEKRHGFGRVEEWLSGYSLEKFATSLGMSEDVIALFDKFSDSKVISDRIREGAVHLGLAIANAVVLLDPDKVLLAGGIGYNRYDILYPEVDSVLRDVLPPEMYREDLLSKALLEPYSVVVGATYSVESALLLDAICE